MGINKIPTDNTTKVNQDNNIIYVYIPIPAVLPPVVTYDNANTFTFAMKQSLAQYNIFHRITFRQTNYTK